MNSAVEAWAWLATAKPVLATVVLILFWAIESVLPAFFGRTRRISHAAANLALGLLNAVVAAALFGAAMLAVTEWARQQPVGFLHWNNDAK